MKTGTEKCHALQTRLACSTKTVTQAHASNDIKRDHHENQYPSPRSQEVLLLFSCLMMKPFLSPCAPKKVFYVSRADHLGSSTSQTSGQSGSKKESEPPAVRETAKTLAQKKFYASKYGGAQNGTDSQSTADTGAQVRNASQGTLGSSQQNSKNTMELASGEEEDSDLRYATRAVRPDREFEQLFENAGDEEDMQYYGEEGEDVDVVGDMIAGAPKWSRVGARVGRSGGAKFSDSQEWTEGGADLEGEAPVSQFVQKQFMAVPATSAKGTDFRDGLS